MSSAESPADFGTYDVVIVGAGSSGCVLANRLSANPRRSVLLIEAGRSDNHPWVHIPVGYLFAIALMIFCSILTIWFFRYKKWL